MADEICPHCNFSLSKKAYETHKRLYYNTESDQWIKKHCLIPDEQIDSLVTTELALEECEFDLDDSENSDSHSDLPPVPEFDDMSVGSFDTFFDPNNHYTFSSYIHALPKSVATLTIAEFYSPN